MTCTRTGIPGVLGRAATFRVSPRRSRASHFALFLKRKVGSAYEGHHPGEHAYRTLDEEVHWHADSDAERDPVAYRRGGVP